MARGIGASEGGKSGQGQAAGSRWPGDTPTAARSQAVVGKTGGGGAEFRVVWRLKKSRWGLVCKIRKVQGLDYKLKLYADLGLK